MPHLPAVQVIHVKRAWARQLRNAAVLESLEDQDYMWSSPVLGAQRGLPVAVVTNIPALPIIVYAFLLKRRRLTTRDSRTLGILRIR